MGSILVSLTTRYIPSGRLVLTFDKCQHKEVLIAGTNPEFSDLAGLGRDLRICISKTFPYDTDAAGLRITLWEPLP